VHFW